MEDTTEELTAEKSTVFSNLCWDFDVLGKRLAALSARDQTSFDIQLKPE